ncbi:hypothetical protein N7450_001608 [Penicillium hetheringtonii]|uniref:Uncharacterized protein n=1 Tax=Penicillium hetheringtonii TaxID=911720 RepID=A0AAD6H2U5_9EURO|nr:hypothetical protein N7450_001608 [Penicillium hetheringtonii]
MARRLSDTLKDCLCCSCLDSDSSSSSSSHQSQNAPSHHTPSHHTPSHHTPSHHTPSHHTPSHHTPSHHTPSHHTPSHGTPSHLSRNSGETTSSNESTFAAAQHWNKDDPIIQDDPALSHLKYNRFQQVGQLRQKWMEDPNEPGCPVTLTTLTFADLKQSLGFSEPTPADLDRSLKAQADQLGLPTWPSAYFNFDHGAYSSVFTWIGQTGPGVISINEVFRIPTSDTPRIAYVTKAIYEYKYPLSSLKHVFVMDIINKSTYHFFKKRLYTDDIGLAWPKLHDNAKDYPPRTWESGTSEYEGLLGTQFGKVISYLVLCAYPRGTRRIARIVTRPIPPCMRFDIENISN